MTNSANPAGFVSGGERPLVLLAADIVRMEGRRLAEHWDVLQEFIRRRRKPLIPKRKKGDHMKSKSAETKPSIVFCHGLWADGSCFSKLIVPLLAEGYECIAAQYGLNSTAEDVALVKANIS